jgi:hypothetical protein
MLKIKRELDDDLKSVLFSDISWSNNKFFAFENRGPTRGAKNAGNFRLKIGAVQIEACNI